MKNFLVHLSVLGIFIALFGLSFTTMQEYAIFAIGVVVGFSLLFVDRVVHAAFLEPESEFSLQVQGAWQQKQFGQVFSLLTSAGTIQQKLMTRSVIFFAIYIALAIYVLTSTGSVLAVGVVLGMGLHYCLDLWRYRQDLTVFHQHFLWQVQRQFSATEVSALVIGFTLFIAALSAMVLF